MYEMEGCDDAGDFHFNLSYQSYLSDSDARHALPVKSAKQSSLSGNSDLSSLRSRASNIITAIDGFSQATELAQSAVFPSLVSQVDDKVSDV